MKNYYKKEVKCIEDKVIIILAGGTLGHINPALVISKMFHNDGYKVIFITTNNSLVKSYFTGNNHLINNCFTDVKFMDSPGFSKRMLKNFKSIFLLIKTKKEINKIYKETNPVLVIGFGGSISTIGLMNNKYKSVLHEQNAIPGNGNKFISKFYKNVHRYSSFPINGYILVDNPLITNAFENKLSINKDNILIFGGSNGSDKINDFILTNFNHLKFKKKVYLFTGKKYYERNKITIEKYKRLYKDKIEIIDTSNNMRDYYNKAYIVIGRAGAGTLSEILGYKIPSIIIPSPNVLNNHQYYNAKYLENKKMIVMIEEKDLNVENFISKYEELLEKKDFILDNMNEINVNSKYLFYENLLKIINE